MKILFISSKKHGVHEVYYDEESQDLISRHKWTLHKSRNTYYVRTRIDDKTVYLHRLLLGITDPSNLVDHKNNNGLDNRKENLRSCTLEQNTRNQVPQTNTISKYKGVSFDKRRKNKPWRARMRLHDTFYSLGSFSTEKEAALAYNKGAINLFHEFARVNEV